MKLNRIKGLCLEAGSFELITGPGGHQWIGNGHAYYRVYGARMDIDELDRLLNVKAKQAGECQWNAYDWTDNTAFVGTYVDGEPPCRPVADVYGWDQKLLALDCGGKMMFVRYALLEAMEGGADGRYGYALRRVNGMPFVACYDGMILEALLSPLDVGDTKIMMEALERLTRMEPWDGAEE